MTGGRGRRDETGLNDEELFVSRYQTIPVGEDQDIDWSSRGLSPNRVVSRRDKTIENAFTAKYLKTHAVSKFGQETDKAATSRFGDSDSAAVTS